MRSARHASGVHLRYGAVKLIKAIVLGAILAGCSKGPTNLGRPVEGAAASVEVALAAQPGGDVVVQGVMTKKCPVAGCWFILSEGSRSVKVDTKDAGFVVVDVPLDTKMTVAGRMITNGEERVIEATGVLY
jgi:hypothetical protein